MVAHRAEESILIDGVGKVERLVAEAGAEQAKARPRARGSKWARSERARTIWWPKAADVVQSSTMEGSCLR